ncbi:MAG: tetratricopeptide repeat protein [bacterium]
MVNRLIQLNREIKQDPHNSRLWIDLASVRMSMGERDEAIKALESAKRCAPEDNPGVWAELGTKFAEVKLFAQAREMLVRACAQEPASADFAHRLGSVLVADDRLADGAAVLAAAVWIAPTEPTYRVALAKALLAARARSEAEHLLRVVLERSPQTADAWLLQAEIELSRHDPPAAIAALERAFAQRPRERALGMRLAELLRDSGDDSRAVEVLRSVAGGAPEDVEVLVALARAQGAAGDRFGGIRTLEATIELPEVGIEAFLELGVMYKAAGRLAEALDPLQFVVEQDPENADAHYHLGEALLGLGEAGQAVSVLVKGAMLSQDDRRLRSLLQAAAAAQGGGGGDPHGSVERAGALGGGGGPRPSDLAFTGDLAQFGLVDLLEFLRLNRRTGVLQIVSTQGMGELQMSDGRMIGANTSNSTRLAELLLKAGMLDVAALDAIEAEQGETSPLALVRAVLDRGVVKAAEMRAIVYQQAQDAIGEIMGWEDGYFAFQGDESLKGMFAEYPEVELDTSSIMLELLRRMDEDSIDMDPDDLEFDI